MFKKKEETLQYLSIKRDLKFKKKERKTTDETESMVGYQTVLSNCALLKTSSKMKGNV